MWSLLDAALPYTAEIEHVGVINDTVPHLRAWRNDRFAPCVVLALTEYTGDQATATIDGRDYVRVWSSTQVAVYQPAWFVR